MTLNSKTRNGEPVTLFIREPLPISTPLAFGPTVAMSRRRAIWYGAALAVGVALIAVGAAL